MAPSEADRFRMEQGQDIGRLARELYPRGRMVTNRPGQDPAERTRDLIADPASDTLFEAAFRAGSFVAKADILRRQDGAWHVLEVKSSFQDTARIADLVDDLAYTVMVVRRAGVHVARASLVLLSRQYRFGESPAHLFAIVDKTAEVNDRAAAFDAAADRIARALHDASRPVAALVPACRGCDFFANQCLGSGLTRTVLDIPGLHQTKLTRLSTMGIIELSRVPADLNLNERQERARSAALTLTSEAASPSRTSFPP